MFIGVDEAGRGPVIGPLVVCAFAAVNRQYLLDIGVKDSKDLSVKKREEIFEILKEMPHKVIICSPEEIDDHYNLNVLETELFARALKSMPEGKIMLDACDVNATRFANNVNKLSGKSCEAEHKADSNYPEVGAASIIAKVMRDRLIQKLSKEVGFDLGSGYPSDPKTQKAVKILTEGETPHPCLRWSWKTVENAWGGNVPPRPSSSQQTLF
jgi:ribonuclease HII